MHTLCHEKTVKPYAVLQALRKECGFSIGEMAAVLGVPKATYQGYETGRRSTPDGFVSKAHQWRQRDLEYMAGIAARVDAFLDQDGWGE